MSGVNYRLRSSSNLLNLRNDNGMTAKAANLFRRSGLKSALLSCAGEPNQSKTNLAVTKPGRAQSSSADGPVVKRDSTPGTGFDMAACVARVRELDDRSRASEASLRLVGPPENPIPQRGGGHIQIAGCLAYGIDGRLQNVASLPPLSLPNRRRGSLPARHGGPRPPWRLGAPMNRA